MVRAQEGREDGMKWAEGFPYGGDPSVSLPRLLMGSIVSKVASHLWKQGGRGMRAITMGVWLGGLLAAMIEDCHVHRPFRAAIPNPFGAAQEGDSGMSEQSIALQALSPSLFLIWLFMVVGKG